MVAKVISIIDELERQLECLPLVGMELQYASLFSLLESTVERGQGNSILIQGPVGTGKTKLVEAVIKDLCSPHYVVKLDGYIHTDNKIALRAIIRQLNIAEGSLADDVLFDLIVDNEFC